MTKSPQLLTVGSLFAGIGGLELGLEQTGGFKTIWSVEIEGFCNDIRKRHWPDVPQFNDVREFPPREGIARPDLICGGSPCQDLSCAGKRAGLGGERSGLFLEMVRIIRELSPMYVVWENVRGAFSSGGGADFRAVLGHFSNLGYDAEWTMLRASDFGLSQRRARIFLVAYRNEQRIQSKNRNGYEKKSRWYVDSQPMRKLVQDDVPGPLQKAKWARILEQEDWRAPSIKPDLCRNFDGVPLIVDASRKERIRALGNAVVPACARWVGERILEWERR